jgi:hypothetical protein
MGTPLSGENPKVGELQMDWLRSEDLKEEKVVTTPVFVVAGLASDPLTDSFRELIARL